MPAPDHSDNPTLPTLHGGTAVSSVNPGARVDRYVLLWELGRGGMGTVWAAFDPRLDRKVALKLLLPGLSREDGTASTAQARLLREAQALARVTHPHTVTVFDVGTAGGQVFLAMEHLAGQTLKAWSKEQPRDWREVVRVMSQAARGLMAVHAAGLVHRDFKPGNVIITTDGTAKVLDFGLARAVKGLEPREAAAPVEPEPHVNEDAITALGAICGTPGYLAPELLEGKPSSPASDQFAFGVTLSMSLYGQRPLGRSMSAASVRADLAQLAKRPPPGSDVPNWLHAVILRSLAEQPEARFASIGALLAEVERHTQRWSLARAWPVLAALVLVLGAVGAWAPWRRPPCPSERELLSQALPPDWRRALEARPGGRPSAHFLEQVDRTVATWAHDSLQVCLDVHRGPPSVSALQRRDCLDRRGIALSATLEVLGHADGAPGQLLDQVFEGTLERMSCDTPGQVARGNSDDVPPGLQAKARGLRTLLVRASALALSGQSEAAQTLSTRAATEAADAGLQGFQAEALHVMASVELARGWQEPALQHAEQSMNLALAAGTDAQAIVSASQLALAMSYRADQLPMAKALVRTAAALSSRQGSPDDLESPLNYARMAIALADGNLDEGLRVAQRRLELALSLHGEDSLAAQDAHDALGVAWWSLGNVRQATEETAAGIATAERTGRDMDPGLMSNYLNLAVGLRHTGRAADARRALEKGAGHRRDAGHPRPPGGRRDARRAGRPAQGRRAGPGPEPGAGRGGLLRRPSTVLVAGLERALAGLGAHGAGAGSRSVGAVPARRSGAGAVARWQR